MYSALNQTQSSHELAYIEIKVPDNVSVGDDTTDTNSWC